MNDDSETNGESRTPKGSPFGSQIGSNSVESRFSETDTTKLGSNGSVGTNSIATKRSYWYGLGEQIDSFKKYNRYEV